MSNVIGLSEPVTLNPAATHFRIKRLDTETGYWRTWMLESEAGPVGEVPVSLWRDSLPSALPPGVYRVVWMRSEGNERARPIGYSKTLQVGSPEGAGTGVSNTPGKRPPEGEDGSGLRPGVVRGRPLPNVLTFDQTAPQAHDSAREGGPSGVAVPIPDTLALMRGISMVLHAMADPMIQRVQEDARLTIERERLMAERMLERERASHAAALERDRQFVQAIQAVYQSPGSSALTALQGEVAALRGRLDVPTAAGDDAGSVGDDEQGEEPGSPWAGVVKAAIETAPDLIQTVADQIRQGVSPAATVDTHGETVRDGEDGV